MWEYFSVAHNWYVKCSSVESVQLLPAQNVQTTAKQKPLSAFTADRTENQHHCLFKWLKTSYVFIQEPLHDILISLQKVDD